MSAWSGIAAAAVALSLVFIAAGQPVWEWRLADGPEVEVWSYRLFGVDHTVTNTTTNSTTQMSYAYSDLPSQPRMSALFIELARWVALSVVAALGGIGLSIATAARKFRGLFAGVASLGACLMTLLASLYLVFAIPNAAADLPMLNNQPITDFRGQQYVLGGARSLTWGPLLGWFLLLAVGLVLAWGASEMWHVRVPKKRAVVRPAPLAKPQPAQIPPPPPVQIVAEPPPQEPSIDEVFVIAPSGLLVKHMSRSLLSDKDRDVVGGMISVVSNFVREAFTEKDGDVQEIQLGGHRFIMVNDDGLVIAVMAGKGSTEDILHRIRHLAALLLDHYGERLTQWEGEPLDGIEDELAVLWEPFFVPPPPAD